MKELGELTHIELMLRALVYAYDMRDDGPFGMAFLGTKMEHAKQLMREYDIPQVGEENRENLPTM